MPLVMVSWGLCRYADLPDGGDSDYAAREMAAMSAVFSLGPAWHGRQAAVFVRTAVPIDHIVRHMQAVVEDHDFLMVIEIPEDVAVRYLGPNVDEEGFEALFPNALAIADAGPNHSAL